MAFVWSCGIQFNTLVDAEKAKNEIGNITLSDGSSVELYKEIISVDVKQETRSYTLCLMAHQMQIAGNENLLSFPFYYEIRDFFYHFIYKLKNDFNLALFEFEGADRIAFDNVIQWINEYGLGEILNSDTCPDLKVSESVFQEKRLLDGLIISDKMRENLKEEYLNFFVPYKKGYFWLPLKTKL